VLIFIFTIILIQRPSAPHGLELSQGTHTGRRQLRVRVIHHDVSKHLGGVQQLEPVTPSLQLVCRPPIVPVLIGEDEIYCLL